MVCVLVATALLAEIYEPVGIQGPEVVVSEDGQVWLVVQASTVVSHEGRTVVWDLAGWGADAAAARLRFDAGEAQVWCQWQQQMGDLVQWRLASQQEADVTVPLRLSAPVTDLKVERHHVVTVSDKGLDWQCRAKLSGWKGKRTESTVVHLPDGTLTLALQPDQVVSAPVWQVSNVPYRWELRWDSRGGETAVTTLVVDRPLGSPLGVRTLPPGRLTLVSKGQELQRDFPGAKVGERLEIAATPEETVRVQRTRAAATQINVRTDVHRRVAAFDEKLEYEYAVINGGQAEVTLYILEHPGKGWRVEEATHSWARKDAETVILEVPLTAGSKQSVRMVVIRSNLTPE
jgi:hypothetical protein